MKKAHILSIDLQDWMWTGQEISHINVNVRVCLCHLPVCSGSLLSSSSMSNSDSLSSYSTFSSSSLKSGAKALQFSCRQIEQSHHETVLYQLSWWLCFIKGQIHTLEHGAKSLYQKQWLTLKCSICSFILYCHRLLTTWFWAQMDTTPLEMEAIIGRTGCHWTEVKGKMGKLPDCKQHTASIELEICLQKCCISA